VVAGKAPEWHRVIEYNPDFCMQLGGLEVSRTEQKQILENLGFKVTGEEEEAWAVEPPSWRGDVAGRADIVEEVLRIKGFDKLPAISVHNSEAVTHPAETRQARLVRLARTSLAASGLDECITWSFMQTSLARKFGANDQDKIRELTLVNPINAELDLMRPTSLPNLIAAAGRNCDRGYPDTALFEVGPVFHSADESGQVIIAAGALSGNSGPRHWSGPDASRIVDAYDAKACAMSVLETCNAPADNLLVGRDAGSWYHPGRSGTLALGKTVLAQFGEIHPVILEEMDIKVPVVGFEIYLDQIPVPRDKGKARQNLDMSQFQPVSRDFAFIVDYNVEAESLIRAVKNTDKRLIKDVYVFDIYTGKGVEEGKKSVALSVVIQPREKTLTETEIESISQKIADSISSKTGGILRT
jgi:phenylalanyl-tRNA synthetase beta chain